MSARSNKPVESADCILDLWMLLNTYIDGIPLIREVSLTRIVTELTRDEILTSIATVILLFTAMVNWNVYSWLLLLAIS